MKTVILFILYAFLTTSIAFAEKSDIERFKSLVDQAAVEQKAGNYKVAIKLFRKVYSKSNDLKREALLGLISSLKESKKWADAVEYLKIEKKRSPFIGEYRIWLTEVYTAAGQFNEALEEINYAEKIIGQDNLVLHIKSSVLQKLGKHVEVTQTLNAYLGNNPKDYIALADRGDAYFQQKLYIQSYKDFQRAYELRPFDERVISSYVQSAYFTHNHREIRKVGQECTQLFPKNITCFEYLGKSSLRKKSYEKALSYFNAAIALDPSRSDIRQLLAESLALHGNFVESDIHFDTILKQHPDSELALRSWAPLLKQRKKIELLGATLTAFNKNNPGNIWCSVELSMLLLLVGDRDASLEQMQTISKESKSILAKYYYAFFLYSAGKYEDSRVTLLEVKEPSFDIDFHLALVLFKENKLADAIQHWLKVPIESVLYFKSRINAALAFEQQNNLEKAREILSSVTPPTAFKKDIEKKLSSLAETEKRNPASNQPSNLSYFTEWSMPAL